MLFSLAYPKQIKHEFVGTLITNQDLFLINSSCNLKSVSHFSVWSAGLFYFMVNAERNDQEIIQCVGSSMPCKIRHGHSFFLFFLANFPFAPFSSRTIRIGRSSIDQSNLNDSLLLIEMVLIFSEEFYFNVPHVPFPIELVPTRERILMLNSVTNDFVRNKKWNEYAVSSVHTQSKNLYTKFFTNFINRIKKENRKRDEYQFVFVSGILPTFCVTCELITNEMFRRNGVAVIWETCAGTIYSYFNSGKQKYYYE